MSPFQPSEINVFLSAQRNRHWRAKIAGTEPGQGTTDGAKREAAAAAGGWRRRRRWRWNGRRMRWIKEVKKAVGRNEEVKEGGSNRAELGFRSDRAVKTNRVLSAADSSPWLLVRRCRRRLPADPTMSIDRQVERINRCDRESLASVSFRSSWPSDVSTPRSARSV